LWIWTVRPIGISIGRVSHSFMVITSIIVSFWTAVFWILKRHLVKKNTWYFQISLCIIPYL
jgi:hypothetical protein